MGNPEQTTFGTASVLLHWSIALLCFVLLAMGFWMVDLDESHKWVFIAPFFHKLLGTLLLFLLIIRILWTKLTPPPAPLPHHKTWERKTAHLVHILLNLLLLVACVSGNVMLLATADRFSVHGAINLSDALGVQNLKDLAHQTHSYIAYVLMGIILFHLFAVLKHTVIDKDKTFWRIFGK